MGGPHLARFSRDVGYHGFTPGVFPPDRQRTLRFAVSHISRKTSEMWATRRLWQGRNLSYWATRRVMVMPGSTRWPARGLWLNTVPAGSTVSAGAICPAAGSVSVSAGALE